MEEQDQKVQSEQQEQQEQTEPKKEEIQFKSALKYIEEGNKLVIRKCFLDAINAFNKASEISPNFAKPHYQKALVYYHQKKLDKAEEEWNIAFDLEWLK